MTDFPSVLPASRTPDPGQSPPVRWGVLAPGRIAGSFFDAVTRHTPGRLVAVGSRSAERGAAFAQRFGAERSYSSYEELVADPGVDAVYIASPHSEHAKQALLSIAAGKPVLVEKPFARNAAEAATVAEAARAAGVLAMEAMWTRFLPQTDVIAQLLADGVLGEVGTVLADHGQYFEPDPRSRLFDPHLAGGALLDLGVYPISFASFVLGPPEKILATGTTTSTGVDKQASMTLTTGSAQACLNTTLSAQTPTTASISGTAGRVEISGPFYAPATLAVYAHDGRRLDRGLDAISGHHGMCHEAAHFATLVRDAATESPLLPLTQIVSVLSTIDEIRRQLGVSYPGER